MSLTAAELRRALNLLLRELKPRVPAQTPSYKTARTINLGVLTAADLASTTNGRVIQRGGVAITNSAASHGGAVLEVCFGDRVPVDDEGWRILHPGKTITPPAGQAFSALRVRRQSATWTPASGDRAYLEVHADPSDLPVEEKTRSPNVTASGALEAILKALTLAGADVDVVASDEGALASAIWTGSAYERWRGSANGVGYVSPIYGYGGVASGAGVLGATTQRVTLATDDPAVTDLAAMEVLLTSLETLITAGNVDLAAMEVILAAIQAAVEIVDDWDESDRAKVNPIAGQAGIAADRAVPGATTARVAVAPSATCLTGQVSVGATSTLVSAVRSNRAEILVKNMGPDACYVSADGGAAAVTDFELLMGESIAFKSIGSVYAIRGAADVATVCWAEEY